MHLHDKEIAFREKVFNLNKNLGSQYKVPQPKPIDRAKRLSSSSSTEHDSSSFIKTVDSMTGEVIHKTGKSFNRPKEKSRKTKLTPVVTYAPVGYAKEQVSDKYESMTIATKGKEMTDETIGTNDERKKIKENHKPSYVQREPSDYDKGKDLRSPKAKGRNNVWFN